MAVFRIERTRDYTVMSNHHLRNHELSLKAKGLLSMMLSLPDDWNYTTRGLAKICKEGVDAIGNALRELETAGYIVRHQLRDRQGRISDTEYVIYEQPQPRQPETPGPDTAEPDTASPDTENPYMDKPDTEKPAELNIEKSNTQKSITQGASTDSIPFREPAAAQLPERKGRDAMSVSEMLRCIGASKQQIVNYVRLEALNWCKSAIPIGCALGTAICWICCAILRFFVKGEWADMPLFAVSPAGILCGAVVGIITVLIAAHSPAKQAAKVSPAAAVTGNTDEAKKIVHAANTKLFKVETSLGINHATRRKKNLFLMTGSFALTIILFLTFSACLDVVNKLLPSAVSEFTPDITIASENDTNSIDRDLLNAIEQVEGVDWVFGFGLYAAYPVEVNGNETTIDLFSHDEQLLDKFKNSVVSGDIEKVYGDENYAMAVYNQSNRLSVGDKIKIGDQEVEIACVTSEGIGSVSDAPTVVCSEETFARLTGDNGFVTLGVVLQKDAPEAAVREIYDLAEGNLVSDNRESNNETSGSYWVFRIAAYGFLAIISLITVLNIMNSISMSVSARIKQYGVMRAVGMGNQQVTKMITAEATTYAACGTVTGIAFGLLFHYLIYVKIIITHFGGGWNIPFSTIGIIILLVMFSCIVAVHGPAKRMQSMAITETINEL